MQFRRIDLDSNRDNHNGDTPVVVAAWSETIVLRVLVAHPSVDLETRDNLGTSLQEFAVRVAHKLNDKGERLQIVEEALHQRKNWVRLMLVALYLACN